MKETTDAPAAVQNLQNLCKDILKASVLFERELYWCKRGSHLDRDGLAVRPAYSVPISALVKAGVLRKAVISINSPVQRGLPDKFFVSKYGWRNKPKEKRQLDKMAHVYIVQKKDQLELFARNVKEASKFVGYPSELIPLSFKRALQRVKEEIDSHPDPSRFFLSVVNRLLPREQMKAGR